MLFDRVVQQGRADDVCVVNAVVDDDPECYAEHVVDERFTLPVVERVQPSGELECLLDLAASGRVAESGGLSGKPFAESAFTVERGNRVERHVLDNAPLDDVTLVDVGAGGPRDRVPALAALPAHLDLVGTDAELAFEDVGRAAHGARLADRPLGRVDHQPPPPLFHQSVDWPVRHSSGWSSVPVSAGLPT